MQYEVMRWRNKHLYEFWWDPRKELHSFWWNARTGRLQLLSDKELAWYREQQKKCGICESKHLEREMFCSILVT